MQIEPLTTYLTIKSASVVDWGNSETNLKPLNKWLKLQMLHNFPV